MPVLIVHSSVPQVAQSLNVVLEVGDDTAALAITVTNTGPLGHKEGPRNAHVIVTDPKGHDVSEASLKSDKGQMCILLEKPMPGTWHFRVEYGSNATAEINASALKWGWKEKLLAGSRWFACKTCKLALRALVIATILHFSHLVAAGAAAHTLFEVVANTKPIIIDILRDTLCLDGGALPKFFSVIAEYMDVPVDNVLERVCTFLQLCAG
jgi:hypothetical protein